MRRTGRVSSLALLVFGVLLVPSVADGAVAFRAAASSGTVAGGATTLSIAKPAGTQAGDVMLASLAAQGSGAITPPSGWTVVQDTPNGTTGRQASYVHVAGASEPTSYSWSLGTTRIASGGVLAYSGVDNSTPVDISGSASGGAGNAVAPSVITTAAGDEIVVPVTFRGGAAVTVTPAATLAERYDRSSGGAAGFVSTEAADTAQAAAGATGTKTAVPSAGTSLWIAHTIALKPAPAGSLSVSTPTSPSFSTTLTGSDQTASYTLPLSLGDTRGTGAGWNLQLTSTQFTAGASTLPATASSVTAASATCAGGTCTAPVNSVVYPVGVPAGAGPPSPARIFNAAAGSGTGNFTVTPTIGVTIPANADAGTYASTLTVTVVNGP